MVSHRRYALRRHSSSHSGSFFFAEMSRTVSSLSPRGMVSASMSVTKPYWYSRLTSCSMELLMELPQVFVLTTAECGVPRVWVRSGRSHVPLCPERLSHAALGTRHFIRS